MRGMSFKPLREYLRELQIGGVPVRFLTYRNTVFVVFVVVRLQAVR